MKTTAMARRAHSSLSSSQASPRISSFDQKPASGDDAREAQRSR